MALIHVVLNPGARDGDDFERLTAALGVLPHARLVPADSPEDVPRLALEAASHGEAMVVAAGGDGTLGAVVDGLAKVLPRVRVGLLPLGTGNDFARTVGIPTDLDAAVAVLARGATRRIDVVRIASDAAPSRLCVNVAAGGFGGKVDEQMTPEVKERWGPLAYFRTGLAALPERSDWALSLHLAEGLRVRHRVLNVALANGRYAGAGIPVAPAADVEDGLLDIVLFEPVGLAGILKLAPQVLLGRHLDPDNGSPRAPEGAPAAQGVRHFRTASLRLKVRPPMPINADGELLGRVSRLVATVLPRALELVVPAE